MTGPVPRPTPLYDKPLNDKAESPTPMIPFSVLDLCPIAEGSTAAQAFKNSLELARLAERLGYQRFWLAEHHYPVNPGSGIGKPGL